MSSALSKAKELNSKNLTASITFLSSNVDSKSKARYVTTTYTELIRRIARLGLRANIHVSTEQLGYGINRQAALENTIAILETGNKYGVFVWLELNNAGNESLAMRLSRYRGFGIAFYNKDVDHYIGKHLPNLPAKILFNGSDKADISDDDAAAVHSAVGRIGTVVLESPPESLSSKLLKSKNLMPKKDIIFEYRMVYSNRKMNRAIKKGAKLSILVPFGKDWTTYAADKASAGYMRFLAGSLLGEKGRSGA